MNCRTYSTPTRRTWGWFKAGLFGAALALVGTAKAQVDVTATAGTLSQSYAQLNLAFAAINAGTHQGVITIGLSGNTTETASAILNSGAVAPAAWTSMSITPTGSARIIEGTIAGAVVKLNGADNVTIDGRIAGSGRNLTIRNNSTAATTAAVWLASVAALNGCTGNTIRNCEIACGATQNTSTTSTWGIIMNGTTISNTVNGIDNDNNTFQENRVVRCRFGIVTRGTTTDLNNNIQVIDNIVGPASFGVDEIGLVGIFMQADNNSTVRGNTVQFVGGTFANTTAGADRVGIAIGTNAYSATATGTITSTNYTVTRNLIHDIIEERTFSAAGLLLGTTNGANPTNNVVCSNMIYNVKANGTGGDMPVGLGITGGNGDQVVYNSIRMTGDVDPDAGASAASNFGSGIRTSNTAGTHLNLTLKNNIVYMDLSSSSGPTCRYYCVTGTAAAYTWGTGGSNNNDFYYNTGNAQCLTGGLATASGVTTTTQFTTLANWQTAYTNPGAQDGASIQADPGFVGATDLHINLGSTAVNNLGTTAGVTCAVDYDNDARSGTPDIGADEYTPLVCAGAAGGTISPATASACNGGVYAMLTSGSEVGAGVTYQWEVSLTGGGIGFADVVGGGGATTTSYTTGTLSTGVLFYRLRVTCSNGPVTGYSNELTLTVNPQPSVSVDVPTANYCIGNPAIAITATGATTYAWSPGAGLSATTGATVNATVAGTTTYTVTGTDGNGCTNTATSAITVLGANPTFSSVTANPNPTCFNGSSQLEALAATNLAANQMAFAAGAGALDPMAGATTVLTTLNDDSPGTLQPIGFSFVFNGVSHTQWSCTPDGFMRLGSTVAAADFSNGITENTNMPKIMPYYDDMATGTDGNVLAVTTGTAPNRILKVQWFVTIPRNTAGAANSSFQCWLYEGTNNIEFRYGTMGVAVMGASVGIAAGTTVFQSITLTGPTVSTVAANDANAGQPAAGTMYSFSNPTTSYVWTPNTFLNFDNIANPMASGVNVASQAYTVTASNPAGCSATGTVTVNTTAPITAATISGTLAYCTGGSTTLTAVPTDGAGPYTYLWNTTATTAAISVNVPTTFTCTVTDNCGGIAIAGPVSVVENSLPTVAVNPTSATYCAPTLVTLNATGASTYSWAPAAGLSATTGASVDATPAATTTYTVTGTDGNGCVNTATSAIVSSSTPVIASTTSVSPICPGSTSQLQVNLAGPASYCASTHTSGCSGDDVLSVTLNTLSSTTSACGLTGSTPPRYLYNTVATTTLTPAGGPYTLTLTFGTDPNQYFGAWIDYDQDGTLAASEYLGGNPTTAGANGSAFISFSVPGGALNGVTRLRIIGGNDAVLTSAQACGASSSPWGETQDYNVTISGATAPYTYAWTPAGNLDNAAIANPVATLTTGEAYTVTVTNAAGCSAQGTTSVAVAGPVDDGDVCTLDACLNGVITNTFQDADLDGTCDANDGCPNDANKIAPGICGCGVADTDTDGDLTADCIDGCPADPLKIAPGVCGCGVPDTDTDGDLTADCIDGCPNDPNKIAPGVCGCGVADTDTDLDGTADCIDGCPADPLKIAAGICGCGVPEGTCNDCLGVPAGPAQPGTPCDDSDVCTIGDTWSPLCVCVGTFQDTDLDGICDANDDCPTFPGEQGDLCDDGDVCTIGDVITAGCVCAGTFQDTDLDGTCDANDPCPILANLVPGDPCNDGDVDTYNDVIDMNCVCAGAPCALNGVKLTFDTDANAAQITWFIKNTGTNVSVCTGSGLPNSSTITVNCCLADGCYDLEVTDAFGDGINPGGYVLRTATGERIIDNASNGQSFSSVSKSALGFCVPLSVEALVPASCDIMNATLSTVLQAQPNAVITAFPTPSNLSQQGFYGYQYWVTNPHGGYSRRILLTLGAPGSAWPGGTATGLKPTYFALSSINQSAPFIPRDVLLNVRVRTYINGVYGNFGPACRLMLPYPPCTTTQLTSTATPVISCGATGLALSSTIYADAVTGATHYQFEFSKPGYLRRIAQTVRSTALSFVTSPLQNNNCYQVRVRVSIDGLQTYCPFGPYCSITIGTAICVPPPSMELDPNDDVLANDEAHFTLWPNPNDGSLVNISLTEFDANVNTVMVDVTDVYGKLVSTRTVAVQDGYLNTTLAFEQDLAPGLYLVNLQAGEQRFTERLVIQR